MNSSIRKLADFVYSRIHELSDSDKIVFYELLSEIMPTQKERIKAAKAAYAIRESEKAQLVFGSILPKRAGNGRKTNGQN